MARFCTPKWKGRLGKGGGQETGPVASLLARLRLDPVPPGGCYERPLVESAVRQGSESIRRRKPPKNAHLITPPATNGPGCEGRPGHRPQPVLHPLPVGHPAGAGLRDVRPRPQRRSLPHAVTWFSARPIRCTLTLSRFSVAVPTPPPLSGFSAVLSELFGLRCPPRIIFPFGFRIGDSRSQCFFFR